VNATGPLWAKQQPEGPAPGLAYANVVQRVAATLIDYIVLLVVGGVPYALIGAASPTASPSTEALGTWILVIGFFAVYGIPLGIWNGQTIGGRLFGLRVVRRSDGSPIGWARALVRPVGLLITVAIWFISLIVVLAGKEKRTPADALTGTVVVHPVPIPAAPSLQAAEPTTVVEA